MVFVLVGLELVALLMLHVVGNIPSPSGGGGCPVASPGSAIDRDTRRGGGALKMQYRKMTDSEISGVDNAGLEYNGQK